MKNIKKKITAKRTTALCAALFLLTVTLLPTLTACAGVGGGGKVTTLYVYNWGEYISDGTEGTEDVNEQFERWYYDTYGERVKVNYSTYSSNESMYAKISSGSADYDVIIPSDYMIERMISEGLLAPLHYENIPNAVSIAPEFLNADYDPDKDGDGFNDYSVPYMYGMIGIIYNTQMVDEEDIGSWDLMWNEKYAGNILQFNNSRDAFGSAQYYLGIDVNTDDEAAWRQVLDKLKEQKPILQGYVMDEIYNKMENGSAAISSYYAGDFMTMYESNEDLDFYYPSEGTNLYVDAMCIPATSRNQTVAERYINFMLSVDEDYGAPAIANAEYTYYASPSEWVRSDASYIEYLNSIKDGGYDLMYDTDAIPTTSYKNLSGEQLLMLSRLWEELKADVTVSGSIYVICGVIIVVLTSAGIFLGARKRMRDKY